MYCKHCGQNIDDDSTFCRFCGNNLVQIENGTQEKDICLLNTELPSNTSFKASETINDSNKTIKKKRKTGGIIVGLILVIAAAAGVFAALSHSQTISEDDISILSRSVLMVESYDEWDNLIATGSGFVCFQNNTIITNFHVIDGAYSIRLLDENGKRYDVDGLSQYSSNMDIAILVIDKTIMLTPLQIESNDKMQKGDLVYAIGSPLGLVNTVSSGIISSVWDDNGISYIQTTAPISEGSSGGALLDKSGKVIGVTSASYTSGQNLNIAISIQNIVELFATDSEYVELKDFANSQKAYGMEPINVGTYSNATSNALYIFHNYNKTNTIMRINKATNEVLPFSFSGHYINIFNEKIYFVSDNKIYSCDIDGSNRQEIKYVILSYSRPQVDSLYAVKEGLLFQCYEYDRWEATNAFFLLPFNTNSPQKMSFISSTSAFTRSGYYTVESGYVLASEFSDPDKATSIFVNIELDPYNTYYYGNEIAYVIDNSIYTLNAITGTTHTIYTAPYGKLKIRALYNGYIYFHIDDGNIPISVNNPLYMVSEGMVPMIILDEIYPVAMNFVNDKIFFSDGTATTPEDKRLYYSCNLDGSQLTILE